MGTIPVHRTSPPLQSGLDTLALTDAQTRGTSTTLLNHALRALLHERALPLLLDILLLLTERQSIRDAQEQDAGREHPQALARVGDARAGRGHDRVGDGRDLGARVGRHDVAQRRQALV